jgi:2,3-bisphosphoglycerate-dependent phosphoglycerate mutase
MKKLILILLVVLLGQQSANAQKALKVYVVRHAEKLTTDPKDKDPELTAEGNERAIALMKELKGQKIDSVFSTNYKRTKMTGFPLADVMGIAIKTYDPAQMKPFANMLMEYAKGKNILIIGHSNTVLNVIEAFGGTKPVKELTDDDYDYLFTLTIKGNKIEVKVSHYGKPHHAQEANAKEMKSPN